MSYFAHLDHFTQTAAVIVLVVGTARLARLLTWDKYPPAAWVRSKWDQLTRDGEWSVLAHCGYCAAPWIGLANGAWGYFTHLQLAWWLFNIWLTVGYLAAITMAYDGDE